MMHAGGNEEGILKWIETGDKGDKWHEANVFVQHKKAFWVILMPPGLFVLAAM